MANPNVRGNEGRPTGGGQTGAEKQRPEETGAQGMAEKAREAASNVARGAGEAVSNVGRRAEDAASAVGSSMQSLAGTLRESGPREGVLGTASSTLASTLESGGRYLQEEGLGGVMDDLSGLIRRNPIPAVLIGVGIGFLLARTTSRS